MARSTPKLGARAQGSSWRNRPHVLTDSACAHLAGFIGLTPKDDPQALDDVLAEVSRLLGLYPGAVQALDNAPRASEYVRSFSDLVARARKLQRGLKALAPHVREQLDACLLAKSRDLENAEKLLSDLVVALNEGRGLWKRARAESSGRPKQMALRLVVDGLRAVFRQHYRGPQRGGAKRGAVTIRSELETRERDFIKVALGEAHIEARGLNKFLVSLSRAEPPLTRADRRLLAQITHAAKSLRRSC